MVYIYIYGGSDLNSRGHPWRAAVLMLQQEFAERLLADPGFHCLQLREDSERTMKFKIKNLRFSGGGQGWALGGRERKNMSKTLFSWENVTTIKF